MKMEFRLLVIDDEPESAQAAIQALKLHLNNLGFSLKIEPAKDLSDTGLRTLTRNLGKDFDLVLIDYALGTDVNGSDAAAHMRRSMPYTDIIFFSSDAGNQLIMKLADKGVSGVFVSHRTDLIDTLTGVADTIIKKAIDLNHMRGIAMAEVAEFDVLLQELLLHIYSYDPEIFPGEAEKLLEMVQGSSNRIVNRLTPLLSNKDTIAIIADGSIFSSHHKYKGTRELAKALPFPPREHLRTLAPYGEAILKKRNILAHAKEELDANGETILRSVVHGEPPVRIDEQWMTDFRKDLKQYRAALETICQQVRDHSTAVLTARG